MAYTGPELRQLLVEWDPVKGVVAAYKVSRGRALLVELEDDTTSNAAKTLLSGCALRRRHKNFSSLFSPWRP
jgi:hypothetical protein